MKTLPFIYLVIIIDRCYMDRTFANMEIYGDGTISRHHL